MRKKGSLTALWLILCILFSGCTTPVAPKAEVAAEAGSADGALRLVVDGEELQTDAPPVMQNDRVLVPMRSLFEAVGLTVGWDGETGTVTGENEETAITLKIGEKEALVSGQTVTLDVPAVILNDRTYVPVRFVSESAGLYVEWIGAYKTVSVRSEKLGVYFLDVGQADAAIVALPDGRSMLIDAGNRADADKVLSSLWVYGFGELDYVVGTHPHEDHIGAMAEVLREVPVGTVLMPEKTASTAVFENVLDAIEEKSIHAEYARPGNLLAGDGFLVDILAPLDVSGSDLNDASVVLRIAFDETEVLMTGDATEESEGLILASGADVEADVLKVGHHGSDTSSSEAFLRAVSPKAAVVSVGEGNSYGHPSPSVMSRMEAMGIELYRTDLSGDIVFRSDGDSEEWQFGNPSAASVVSPKTEESAENTGTSAPNTEEASGQTVMVVGSGARYHRADCRYVLEGGDRVREKTLTDALSEGYTPCKVCEP